MCSNLAINMYINTQQNVFKASWMLICDWACKNQSCECKNHPFFRIPPS